MPKDNNPINHCDTANRLLHGKPPTTFGERVRNAFGATLGQSAFNYVTGSIPRLHVGNNVNAGVRRLVDAVNSGNKSFAGKTINAVSRVVMGAAGINPNVVPPDPNGKTIYDSGKAASEAIGEGLLLGAVDMLNLPGNIDDLTALAFLQQTKADEEFGQVDSQCGISPYAMDLITFAPKFNYMFMVQITFQPDYVNMSMQESQIIPHNDEIKFPFLCHHFVRPVIKVEHDQINMYNFRTHVAKRVDYDPITLKLYDDNKNSSMVFLEKYLKLISPVARKSPSQQDVYEQHGMRMDVSSEQGDDYLTYSSGSMGGLINQNKSILRKVEVFHIFNYGTAVNKYTFVNPKVIQMTTTDFNMAEDEIASIELQMIYDSVFIETDMDLDIANIKERSQLGTRRLLKFPG
jgi:hypothetical protein